MLGWFTSKFSRFATNEITREMLGSGRNDLDLAIMDHRRILLVRLPKGLIGEVNAASPGYVLTTRMWVAALNRADAPATSRTPFTLYVDEFQNFTVRGLTRRHVVRSPQVRSPPRARQPVPITATRPDHRRERQRREPRHVPCRRARCCGPRTAVRRVLHTGRPHLPTQSDRRSNTTANKATSKPHSPSRRDAHDDDPVPVQR